MEHNILLCLDSYKCSHHNLYKPGTQVIYSYLESRGGEFPYSVFFGLQYYLKKYLCGIQVTKEKIDEAEIFWAEHFGKKVFSREKWEYILDKHDGKLPLLIKAVPEGFIVPILNPLVTIENTDDECYWLTNAVETLLMKLWYNVTVSTQSYSIRQDILKALDKSGDPAGIDYKLIDFGFRGVSCEEQAAVGAASNLLSFRGTDTVAGIRMLQKYYSAGMVGNSIVATEHSVMCSYGRDNEEEACKRFLDLNPDGLAACVSDTYDIFNCCENIWGGKLREKVLARNGTLIIRPDSGNPNEILPKILNILWDKFGGTINDKGYKVLDSHVRIIQGDGCNKDTIPQYYDSIMSHGFSADNMAVGSGGGLLMSVSRDSMKFAIKASAAKINGEWIDIFKDPITDKGKMSKKGRLSLIKKDGKFCTVPLIDNPEQDYLKPVFRNGELLKDFTFDEVKNNLRMSEVTVDSTAKI